MLAAETKEIIFNRINLIKRLIGLKNHFQGVGLFSDGLNCENHPYMHYSALRNYLAMTCFDILGQPTKWKEFGTWLEANSTESERDEALKLYQAEGEIQKIISIYKYYNSKYGVKNSFYRFIKEVISEESRKKLMNSIVAIKSTEQDRRKPDGGVEHVYSEEELFDYQLKEKFLYSIRNSFTHKGISLADSYEAIQSDFHKTADEPHLQNGAEYWIVEALQWPSTKNGSLFFGSMRWPQVLIEIIEDTVKELDI